MIAGDEEGVVLRDVDAGFMEEREGRVLGREGEGRAGAEYAAEGGMVDEEGGFGRVDRGDVRG